MSAAEKAVPSGGARRLLLRARRCAELRFIASFVAIAGVLFAAYSFPYVDGSWAQRSSEGYLAAYARLAGGVLSFFEKNVTVSGQNIAGSRYSLRIVRGCDAVDAQILLVAAIFASHVYSWTSRIAGALGGLLLVTLANVIRICCLYYVGAFVPSYFDFFHHEFWPLLLIVLAAAGFLVWSRVATIRRGAARAVA